jgi:hypothetical protein
MTRASNVGEIDVTPQAVVERRVASQGHPDWRPSGADRGAVLVRASAVAAGGEPFGPGPQFNAQSV